MTRTEEVAQKSKPAFCNLCAAAEPSPNVAVAHGSLRNYPSAYTATTA